MKLIVISFVLLLTSCFWGEEEEITYKIGKAVRSGRDNMVPKSLVNKVEKDFIAYYRQENPDFDGKDLDILKRLRREYLDIYVKFRQDRKAAMKSNFSFVLPRGGGVIDLAEYVEGARGSFFIDIGIKKNTNDEDEVTDFNGYFVSNSRRRKIGDQEFGNGCGRYMKMNQFLPNLADGFKVNATDQRYISVLAGTFYFYVFEDTNLYLGNLTFEDTRFPHFHCKLEV